MGRASKIMRRSIYTFLKNYEYFAVTPSLFAFPFSISILLSQSLFSTSSYLFGLVHGRLSLLFLAAGFPPSSELFTILNLKLSQNILTFVSVLPFTFSFLLLAKASVIQAVGCQKLAKQHSFSSLISVFNTLFITQLCNSFVILSAYATSFCILLISFNIFDILGLSSPGLLSFTSAVGVIIYSIILVNAYTICNLSLLLSGIEKRGGFISILRTCVLIRGRTITALSIVVPINMALAAIEVLFQYRVMKAYRDAMALDSSMVLEGLLIAYMYTTVLTLDTILGREILESCKNDLQFDQEDKRIQQMEIQLGDDKSFEYFKDF